MSKFDALILIIFISLCAYAPWLPVEKAKEILAVKAEKAKNLTPICDYKIVEGSVSKKLFGVSAIVNYDCTYAGTPHFPQGENSIFLTFFNVVINMPHPVVR